MNIYIKKTITILVLFLLIILLLSCGNDDTEKKKIDKVIFRLPWIHQSQYAGVYVAKAKGFFQDYGIDNIEILQGGPNIRPIDLVSSGSEHFSITGSTPFFNAINNGRTLKIVSTLDQKHAYCYFARKDQGIDSPIDFEGERVGHKIAHEDNLRALLNSAGLTIDDVELVPVPPSMSLFFINDPDKMVPIWPGHAADEPLIAEERGVSINYFFPEDYDGIPRIGNLIFTSTQFENAHPDIVQGVVSAVIEGWIYAFDNIEYGVDVTMQYVKGTEKDREHQKNMLIKMQEFMLLEAVDKKIGWCNIDKWKSALNNYKKIQKNANFHISDILINKYVEEYYIQTD
jgi:NitT/TauT family transport system substrate-binding protein